MYSISNQNNNLYEFVMRDETTGKEKNLFFYCAQPISKNPFNNPGFKKLFDYCDTVVFDYARKNPHNGILEAIQGNQGSSSEKKFSAKRLFTLAMDKSSFFQSKKPKDLIFEKSQQANKSMEYLAYNKGISLEEDELEFFFHNCLGNVEIQNELRKPANINWNTITHILQNNHSHNPILEKIEFKLSQEEDKTRVYAQKIKDFLMKDTKIVLIAEEEEQYIEKIQAVMQLAKEQFPHISVRGPLQEGIDHPIPESWLQTLSETQIKTLCQEYQLRYETTPQLRRFLAVHIRLWNGSPLYQNIVKTVAAREGRFVAFMDKEYAIQILTGMGKTKWAKEFKEEDFPAWWSNSLNAAIVESNSNDADLEDFFAFELTNAYQKERYKMVMKKALEGGFINPTFHDKETSQIRAAANFAYAIEEIEDYGRAQLTEQMQNEIISSKMPSSRSREWVSTPFKPIEHYIVSSPYGRKHFRSYMDDYLDILRLVEKSQKTPND